MQGTYYKTLHRDELTGETDFLFSPLSYCPEAKDGLVTCRGCIAVYYYRLPLDLNGHFEGDVFITASADVASGPEHTVRLLEYFFEGTRMALTESEKKKAQEKIGMDFLAFGRERGENGWHEIFGDKQKVRIAARGCEKLNAQREVSELCARHDLLPGETERLLHCGATLRQMGQNPYLLFFTAGINIYKADSVMAELAPEFSAYHPARIYGYILDAMRLNEQCGNTCITPEALCGLVCRRMARSGLGGSISPAMLNAVFLEKQKTLSCMVFQRHLYLYRTSALKEEETVIRNILRLKNTQDPIIVDVKEAEKAAGFAFTSGQASAFQLLETGGVKILTGPPGSGKTALVRALIHAYRKASGNRPVRLAATTGRAAQVMAAACGEKAETLHKLLDIRPFGESVSSRDETHPVDGNFIVVDEASMLGLKLFSLLAKAVASGSILLLVGDMDQLQSVEYGNILGDMQESGAVEVYRLTEVMRQSGMIYRNAQKINNGSVELTENDSFHIYECPDEETALGKLWEKSTPGKDMLLTTVKKGALGTKELNHKAQDMIGRSGEHVSYGGEHYYAGDAVIMTQTCYEKGYYNGDIGIIKAVGGELAVQFGSREIMLGRDDFPRLELAYCVTIHKAQGSEFGCVHIILPPEPDAMLTRRLLYTAVTRAKRRVSIYSIRGSLARAISNASERPRLSVLGKRLSAETGSLSQNNS